MQKKNTKRKGWEKDAMARKHEYPPMHLLNRWKETEPAAIDVTNGTPLQEINADPEHFLDYAVSPKFAKKSYEGPHERINDYMIKQIPIQKEKRTNLAGNSYAEIRTEMRDLIAIPGIIYKWGHYKQAYIFDPDFADELQQTDNVRIPLSLFGKMPYPCYYVDLSNIEKFSPFIGCFVYVHVNGDTKIPDITLLRITDPPKGQIDEVCYTAYFDSKTIGKYMLDVEKDEHGNYRIDSDHVYFQFDDRFDVGNVRRSAVTDENGVIIQNEFNETHASEFLTFIFQTVFYLASYRPDVTPSKKYAKKTKTADDKTGNEIAKHHEDLTVSDVGIRYGNAIRFQRQNSRKSKGQERAASNKPRKPITSHMRRAHWHKYWTGKGRTTQIVKWIPPVFVCANQELPVTIHQVK